MTYKIASIWVNKYRAPWSNFRHANINTQSQGLITSEYIPQSYSDIKLISRKLLKGFEWTSDGIFRLYDSIKPPAYCFHQCVYSPPLKDDCDGFHAALYWAIEKKYNCYLLTVVTRPIFQSHTMLLVEDRGNFIIVDYEEVSNIILGTNNTQTNWQNILEGVLKLRYQNRYVKIINYNLLQWEGKWVNKVL